MQTFIQRPLNRRSFLKGLGLSVGASALSGPMFVWGQEGVTIGAVIPLTGSLASFGPRFEVAARLAIEQVNAAGGIPGLGIVQLAVRDSGTNPDVGVASATELVNTVGIQALFGAAASGVTIPITSVTVPAGVFQISPSATSPALSGLQDNDLVFRTAPPDSLQGIVLADLAFNKQGYRTIAIIARNDAYGAGLADSLKANFEALGGAVSNVSLYDPNTADYSAEISAASAGNPEAISLITFEEGEALISQMVAAGVTNFDLFVDGNKNQDLVTRLVAAVGADALEGIVGTAPALANTAAGAAYEAAYRQRLNESPFVFTPHSYDALAVTCLAIARAKEYKGSAIAANIRAVANTPGTEYTFGQLGEALAAAAAGEDINYVGVSGAVEFNAQGDPFGPVGTWHVAGGLIVDDQTVDCGFAEDGSAFCAELD
ncbi:MAG TPA: ABC transporter substrate-binding protein [Candidatus Bipolaricaulota bacterium]